MSAQLPLGAPSSLRPILQAIRRHERPVELDLWLLISTGGLLAIGIVMVASSSFPILPNDPFYYLERHLIALGLGSVIGWVLYRLDPNLYAQHAGLLLLGILILLLLPFIPGLGVTINNGRRWINLGVTNFQVVEPVKLLLVLFIAGYCARRSGELQTDWLGILKPLGVSLVVVAALLAQPDFGSAALILAVTVAMIWLAGAHLGRLVALAAIVLPAMALVAVIEPYRVERLVSFIDPWKDQFDSGFQLTQALIAVGRGEVLGVGLGQSVQKLHYLPEAHTDFIVAVLAEEFGLFGLMVTLGLFAMFASRCFKLGLEGIRREKDFLGYAAFGIGLWFSAQALVSIGVNLGVLPTKGLTLPFISSGGSSAMMTIAALGLLFRLSADVRRAEAADCEASARPLP